MKIFLHKQAIPFLLLVLVLPLLLSQTACLSGSKNTQKQSIILKPDLPTGKTTDKPIDHTTNKVPPTPVQPVLPESKLPTTETTQVKVIKEQATIDTISGRLLPQTPAVYSVVLMLPFGASSYQPNAAMDSIPNSSNLALEFYEGVLQAFEKLKQEGISLKVNVLDTENNPDVVEQLLQNPQLRTADVIVGPIYNRELKPVAAFAQKNKIPHISPLSPSGSVTRLNPYYFIANPSIEAQCAAIYHYIAKNYSQKRILAVCSNKPNEVELANLFIQLGNKPLTNKPDNAVFTPVSQLVYAFQSTHEIESYLSATEENMVVVTSFDPLLIHDLSSKLNLLRNKYAITLFGMPNWINLETVDFGYMANLNLHLAMPFFQSKFNPQNQEFKRNYFYAYHMQPTEYACRGYDLMLWLGRALKSNGKNFALYPHEVNPTGIYTNFVFEPVVVGQTDKTGSLNPTEYQENRFVNIVRYRPDFIFEVVNK